jgi:hypothetical protein
MHASQVENLYVEDPQSCPTPATSSNQEEFKLQFTKLKHAYADGTGFFIIMYPESEIQDRTFQTIIKYNKPFNQDFIGRNFLHVSSS